MSESIPQINLFSDTVTKPTPGMYEAMCSAPLGDDMFGEDPTVNLLEERIAELLGKEAAVFTPTATQANQIAVRLHTRPGDELLIHELGHIANYEAGGPAVLSGVTCRTLPGAGGMLDVETLTGKIRPDDQHFPITRLLCLENTTNIGGGRVYPLQQLHAVSAWAAEHDLAVHIDGARYFNAVVAGGDSAADIAACADTVTICFSKGLGCPMGAVLVGTTAQIQQARRYRKLFGGALRQVGVVAGAAAYALEHHVKRLAEDHANAKLLAERIADISGLQISLSEVETNLVFFEVDAVAGTAQQLSTALEARGVRMGALGAQRMRACTHLDASREDVLQAAEILSDTMQAGIAEVSSNAICY